MGVVGVTMTPPKPGESWTTSRPLKEDGDENTAKAWFPRDFLTGFFGIEIGAAVVVLPGFRCLVVSVAAEGGGSGGVGGGNDGGGVGEERGPWPVGDADAAYLRP